MMLGDQDLLPDHLKENKGHNRYFMLPLLLGLVGLFYQYGKGRNGRQGFWIVMLLFFMTGLAIVIYLNQTPIQPRERDYAYAGSFYAFTIWIGLGVLALVELARKIGAGGTVSAAGATALCLLAVPCVMAQQNWDDHDRSGCTVTRDIAYNYLNSCEENAVIFTNGDNDTFPLWYVQEVEGCRTDVRVCNLSYLQTDWYCDQMKRKAYESDPLPISFSHDQYTGDRDVVYIIDRNSDAIDLRAAIEFIKSDNPITKTLPNYHGRINFLPGRRLTLPVDRAKVVDKEVVSPADSDKIAPSIDFRLNKNYILKNELMVLDMLASSDWERPMYYAVTVGEENYVGLTEYFQLEGLTYRLVPIRTHKEAMEVGRVDTERMYENVMHKFRWGFYNRKDIYYDENKIRMATNLRNNLTRLATALLSEARAEKGSDPDKDNADNSGKKNFPRAGMAKDSTLNKDKVDKAMEVLDKIAKELPGDIIPHNYFSLQMAEDYYAGGRMEQGDDLIRAYAKSVMQEVEYYVSLTPEKLYACKGDLRRDAYIFSVIMDKCENAGREELFEELAEEYKTVYSFANDRLSQLPM